MCVHFTLTYYDHSETSINVKKTLVDNNINYKKSKYNLPYCFDKTQIDYQVQ